MTERKKRRCDIDLASRSNDAQWQRASLSFLPACAQEPSRLAKLFIRTPASRQFHSRSTIVLVAALRCAGLTDRRLRRSLAGYSVQPRASRRGWILTPVAGCWNARRVTLSPLAHNYTRLPRRGLRLRIVSPVDTLHVSFPPRECPQTEGTKMSSQILFIIRKSSIVTIRLKNIYYIWIP